MTEAVPGYHLCARLQRLRRVHRQLDERGIAAEAQSFFQLLQQAMAVIVILGFGALLGPIGARGFFVSAAFAAVGALLIWLSLRMRQPKKS